MENRIFLSDLKHKEKLHPYWKEGIGGGQVHLLLRESVRNHLKDCLSNCCSFKYLRCHEMFSDVMAVYREDSNGNPIYDWQYLDDAYDFLMETGIKPFVSFTYMPEALAAKKGYYSGYAKFNASPPKDYNLWSILVEKFVKHCIKRYGLKEVLQWYFEAWNEPDLMFGNPWDVGYWAGSIEDFFKLYEVMSRTLKKINPNFKVGGPATSVFNDYNEPGKMKPPYLEEFIKYCYENNVPLDYVSSHPYPTNFPNNQVDGYDLNFKWREDNALKLDATYIKNLVVNSPFPDIEIHLNEWSSTPGQKDKIHDSVFMAPFIIKNMLECQNIVTSSAFWLFTDIFEEDIKGNSVFSGGYGLVNAQGLRKPSFHAYKFLNMLGNLIIEQTNNYIITKKEDNSVQILLWNYSGFKNYNNDKEDVGLGNSIEYLLEIKDASRFKSMLIYSLDKSNGSVKDAWIEIGCPETPTIDEIKILKKMAEPRMDIEKIDQNHLIKKFSLQKDGVKFIELLTK